MSSTLADVGLDRSVYTAGEIAAINLESARQRSWSRFWRAPAQPQIAELIVEQEQLTAQFPGDLTAFDRLEALEREVAGAEPDTVRAAVISAQVACAVHRFADARAHVAQADAKGAPTDTTARLLLTLDQATGRNKGAVLAARRERIARPGHWQERIPLGALLVDLGAFEEAERTYIDALRCYSDVSPFGPAWVSFLLGALWGECVPEPDAARAAMWYRNAIECLPCYVKARVHLAEILLDDDALDDAWSLLLPVLGSGDPEVSWRLADIALAAGDQSEAQRHLTTARVGFEQLLDKHLLAFADHGAEFYAGSGNDPLRACELARLNFDNRPTTRAREQMHATALAAGVTAAGSEHPGAGIRYAHPVQPEVRRMRARAILRGQCRQLGTGANRDDPA